MKTLHRLGQKYYILNHQRVDSSLLKTRTISCDLHWGNKTYKRKGVIALKFYTTLLPMSVRVMEGGDGGDRWGARRRSRTKNERDISNPSGQMGSSRSITKTNHGDVSYKSCICCNPLRPCCLSKFLLHSVQHEDKNCSTCNATAPLTYHDVRRSFTEHALCRDSRCSHKQNPTVRSISISSLYNDFSTSPC